MAKAIIGKKEMVGLIAEKTGFTKRDSEVFLSAFLESVEENLKAGTTVRIIPFGSFEVRERKERTGRNPRTGKPIKITSRQVPAFKPGKGLKDIIK